MGLNPDVDGSCGIWDGSRFRREGCGVLGRIWVVRVGRQRSVWSGCRRRAFECRPTSASETEDVDAMGGREVVPKVGEAAVKQVSVDSRQWPIQVS
jgi:hypothetical protein